VTNVQAGRTQLVTATLESGEEIFRVVVMRPDFVELAPAFVARIDQEYEEYVASYEPCSQQRLAAVLATAEECDTKEELEALIRTGRELVAYNGFEPSGRIHIAQAVVTVLNANTLMKNGFRFIIYIADWFAQLNHKMDGDLEKIRDVGRYFGEVFKACGLNMEKAKIVWASDLMTQSPTYWPRVLDIATRATLKRVQRCCQIMGRKDTDTLSASQIFYPCMHGADIFELGVDVPQLGIDQRKVNMFARARARPGPEDRGAHNSVAPHAERPEGSRRREDVEVDPRFRDLHGGLGVGGPAQDHGGVMQRRGRRQPGLRVLSAHSAALVPDNHDRRQGVPGTRGVQGRLPDDEQARGEGGCDRADQPDPAARARSLRDG
jgi:hypothetical protein